MEASYRSQLPDELLSIIGYKLDIAVDRLRFRSVCKSWRSVLPFPQPPWLMLAESSSEDDVDGNPPPRGFIGMGEQEIYQLDLPEAHHNRCVGSTGTWLITVDIPGNIRLLNPFSRVQINLPSISTFEDKIEFNPDQVIPPEFNRDRYIIKVVLSSTPSSGKDCIAMAIHRPLRQVSFARPGDKSWTTIHNPNKYVFTDIIFYKQQFYGIKHRGVLVLFEIGDDPKMSLLTDVVCMNTHGHDERYLVEMSDELLYVIKFMDLLPGENSYKLNRFEVYTLDGTCMKWVEKKNLGEYSIFLGFNTSVAVLASHSVKKNCIYFTDDYAFGYSSCEVPGGRCMGVYDLEDNRIKPYFSGNSTSTYSPPLWIIPRMH